MTHRDSGGNVQVDFVWGNMPMQPDDDRDTPLDSALDNHVIATEGYSNFPGFIPDYSGDEDPGLEAVVPDLLRKTRSQAETLLNSLNLNLFAVGHSLTVNYVESTGKTVRVYAYDTNSWNDGQGALNGLRVNDELYFTSLEVDGTPVDFGTITVTKVNDLGEDPGTYFEFKTAETTNYDDVSTGAVWAGPNLVNVITLQRFWNPSGSIKNEGTNVHVRYFSLD